MPTFGSLFTGIGGLDLGLERAGWECRWQVEINPFCRAVLARHWPGVRRYGDIAEITHVADSEELHRHGSDGQSEREVSKPGNHSGAKRVDLLCGGFPCQPVSVAGKREGQADARWLWPEFARCIRLLRPRLVLVENVPGLLSANRGDAMGQVLGDLAACGYDAEWDIVSAADVGAPHRRERVWIVAYAQRPERGTQREPRRASGELFLPQREEGSVRIGGRGEEMADARAAGQPKPEGCPAYGLLDGSRVFGRSGGDSGGDAQWRVEPDVGRVAHGVPARVDRLRALGNAVVPQVAEWIGRRLMAAF